MYPHINNTNPDCEHLGIRDEGYGPYERHDEYCWLHRCWCPSCDGCTDAPKPETDEDCDYDA